MSWRQGVGKCQPTEQTLALIDAERAKARAAIIEELAVDFENSVHHVWDNYEVADRLRDLALSRPNCESPASELPSQHYNTTGEAS
jgi:hypothetical protein